MVRSSKWQVLTIGIVLICGGGVAWGIDYNGGGTHTITGSTEAVNISNATTVQVKSGGGSYPFTGQKVTLTDGSTLTTNFTGGNTGEILRGVTVSVNASKIELTNYTANGNGITLADGAVLTIGNAGKNAYGALLGNGAGGINVTSGTAYVNLYQNINATEKETSFASLRNGAYKITVSKDATLEWLGGIQAHDDSPETLDANVIVNGAGTLILKGGEIGGRYVGDHITGTTSAGELAISGGGTVTFDGASVYKGSKITVTGTGSTLNAAKAASFTGSGEITINSGANLVVGVNDGLQYSGEIILNGGTLNSTYYTTISNGLTLNGGTVTSTGDNSSNTYDSFLFSGALKVTGGTATAPSTSTMEVVGARFRGQSIDVAEYTTLNYSGNVTYSSSVQNVASNLMKTGKGTWNITSGTVGAYYAGVWEGAPSSGTVEVMEGTLRMSGDSTFYEGSQLYVRSGATLDLNTSATLNTTYHLAGDGDNGVGALLFSNNRTVSDEITLDAAASIGVATDVSATISSALKGGQALTKVGKGTLTLEATNNLITALNVLDGTVKLGVGSTLKSNTKSILVSGSGSVLDLAANDALSTKTNAAGSDGIVIENGGKMTNTTETHVTLTNGFTLENGTVTAVGEGNETSGDMTHGLGKGYGNYLLMDEVTVSGTGVSTINAYRIRFRADADGGTFTIAPTAVLETSTKFDTDQGRIMTVCGGGTLHPTATTFTTPGLAIQSSNLDLTGLDNATGGTDWVLLSTESGNASLAMVGIARAMTSMNGYSGTDGIFSMDSGSRLTVDLKMGEDGILGQTIQADGFDIENATLELNLLGDWTFDAVGSYQLFSDELLDAISFASVSVPGYTGELRFGLDGNMLTVGVPEPSSWVLMGLLVLGYLGIRRRGEKR